MSYFRGLVKQSRSRSLSLQYEAPLLANKNLNSKWNRKEKIDLPSHPPCINGFLPHPRVPEWVCTKINVLQLMSASHSTNTVVKGLGNRIMDKWIYRCLWHSPGPLGVVVGGGGGQNKCTLASLHAPLVFTASHSTNLLD